MITTQVAIMVMMMKSMERKWFPGPYKYFVVNYAVLTSATEMWPKSLQLYKTGSQKPRLQRRNSPRHPKQPVVGRAHA